MTAPTTANPAETNETETIRKTFLEYGETFKTLNPLKVLAYYHFPAILIENGSKPRTLPLWPFGWLVGLVLFSILMLELRYKQFQRSDITQLSIQQLSDDLALVSGRSTRFKRDNSELERFGFTYTMRKTPQGWKIIVGTIHDADKNLRLETYS